MPRKDENLSRYLSDMVRYGYWTNEELKRVSDMTFTPNNKMSREYQLEAQVRSARFQMQLDDINGMVYVVPHYACRPSHIQYQGKAYRRSTFDNDIAYPNNPDGIGCANCRHEVTAYYRGIDKQYDESLRNTDELIKQYNDEQKMRYYERNIRKLKLAGEGNDESIRNYYAKMMKHSRDTNTPIQINRTWTISASRYNIGMPNRRLDMMNLLPRTTNESFDYGFVKTTARMTGKRKSYFIDNIDISEINFAPESIRTAYTGRAYGIGRTMTEDAYKSSLETILHTSANSEGVSIIWADKTTTNLLNATGCFYIPKNTDVDSINPFEVYDDFKKYQTTDLLPTSYGIYVDDNGVWRFFYGNKVESDTIYDFSRKPNRQKVSPKIMDTSVKTYKELSEEEYLKYVNESKITDSHQKSVLDNDYVTRVNNKLRNGIKIEPIDIEEDYTLTLLDKFVTETKVDLLAYRYIDNDVYEKIIKGNDSFNDLGFTHVSVLKNKSNVINKPVELRINVPKGTKGVFTKNINESELILNRGLIFKVVSEGVENGKKIVWLEVETPVNTIKTFELNRPNRFTNIIKEAQRMKVAEKPVVKLERLLEEDEIIKRLGGGDKTKGSCMSLAMAYVGNKLGYDVLDFRGDIMKKIGSRTLFSTKGREFIQGYKQVLPKKLYSTQNAVIDDVVKHTVVGEQYMFVFGGHCAIIRKNESDILEFLELQNEKSRWKSHADYGDWMYKTKSAKSRTKEIFKRRFGASDYYLATGHLVNIKDINDDDFIDLLKYINTDESRQKKGKDGTIK